MHNIEIQEMSRDFLKCCQAAGTHLNKQPQGGLQSWPRAHPYENITPSRMDGIKIQFNFSKIDSRFVGSPEGSQACTRHRLIVGVAAGIDWADDETALAKILFELGAPNIIDSMSSTGDLPDEIPAFVPHQERPLDPGRLGDIEGTAAIQLWTYLLTESR